jgi:hypothetical protein
MNRELPTITYLCTASHISRHIRSFSDALGADELVLDQGDTSPNVPSTPISSVTRVRKVSALSDFAPVNMRVKRFAVYYLLHAMWIITPTVYQT